MKRLQILTLNLGPLTQATGPLRSGAGVGVGILRGAGDPFLEFFGFRDLSRFHRCKVRFFKQKVREADRT